MSIQIPESESILWSVKTRCRKSNLLERVLGNNPTPRFLRCLLSPGMTSLVLGRLSILWLALAPHSPSLISCLLQELGQALRRETPLL